jgi:hypothetical protein
MTEMLYSPKIKPEHLARKAIVYLRQSAQERPAYSGQLRAGGAEQVDSGERRVS